MGVVLRAGTLHGDTQVHLHLIYDLHECVPHYWTGLGWAGQDRNGDFGVCLGLRGLRIHYRVGRWRDA